MDSAHGSRSSKSVLHDLGMLLHVPGLLALPALIVGAVAGEWDVMPGFVVLVVVSLAAGQGLRLAFPKSGDVRTSLQLITVAIAWLIIAVLSAIPFYVAAETAAVVTKTLDAFRDPANAFFEAMSGMTSTGLTVSLDASELPYVLQWWRSSMEWVGGLGVILLAVMLIEPAEEASALYGEELNVDELDENTEGMVGKLWLMYGLMTVASIVAFWAAGMPAWEALNHGLTGISTGGFTVTGDSFRSYGPVIKLVALVIMVAGATSFKVHNAVLREGKIRTFFESPQMKAMWVVLPVGILLVAVANRAVDGQWLWIDSAFQWISAFGTCGFASVKLSDWGSGALVLLIGGMFVGGAAGSTAGGLKLRRAVLLFKGVRWRMHEIEEDRDSRYSWDGRELGESEAKRRLHAAASLAVLIIATLALGTVALAIFLGDQYSLGDLLFEASSALGSVGLSVGVTGPDLATAPKLVIALLMWVGRLEITSVLALILAPVVYARRRGTRRRA